MSLREDGGILAGAFRAGDFVLHSAGDSSPRLRRFTCARRPALPCLRRTAGTRRWWYCGTGSVITTRGAIYSTRCRSFARVSRALRRENVHELIRYEGVWNIFQQAHKLEKGVLVAMGHFGNWEMSAFAHAYMTAPMHIVARPIDNARIDALVEQRRELSGNRVIAKKDAARGILRALTAGDAVGVLIDQNTTPDQGVFTDFFGVKACAGQRFRETRAA